MTNLREELDRPAQNSRQKTEFWSLGPGAITLVIVTALVTTLILQGLPSILTGQSANPAQQIAISNATAALGKINAALEVGVNFSNYGQLLIDAKAATNNAIQLAPTSEVTRKMQETMQNYIDAAEVWQFKIEHPPSMKFPGHSFGSALFDKYGLVIETGKVAINRGADPDTAMQKIWLVAESNYRALMSAQSGMREN